MAKILVADDEPEVRRVIVDMLHQAGHETHEAYDGIGALDGVVEHRPDLLLCDWMLPELFGGEVIQKLREEPDYEAFKSLPIIVVSDFADESSEQKFKQAGANGFVAKNDDHDAMKRELLAAIETVLAEPGRGVEPL